MLAKTAVLAVIAAFVVTGVQPIRTPEVHVSPEVVPAVVPAPEKVLVQPGPVFTQCCGQLTTSFTLTDVTTYTTTVVTVNFVGRIGDSAVYNGVTPTGDTYQEVFCTSITGGVMDNTMVYMNVYPISTGTAKAGVYTQRYSPFGNHAITLQ